MTTIAVNGRTMAGDGRRCRDVEIVSDDHPKISRLPDGSLIGLAGDTAAAEIVRRFLKGELARDKLPAWSDGTVAQCLRLYPDGRIVYLSVPYLEELEVELPASIGSGAAFARGAMAAGAEPAEAVAIAARYDTGTGGVIAALEL